MSKVRYKDDGAVVSGDADIIWTEVLHLPDKIAPSLAQPSALIVREVHRQNPLRFTADTLRFTSSRQVPAITATYPEDLSLPDFLTGDVQDIKVARTGTPDTDMQCDAWTDGVALNQGVNHGNESPLSVASQDILVSTRRGYMFWDLTRFANLDAAVGSTMTLKLFTDHAIAIAVDYSVIFSGFAARPFTESTITWSNQPADGSDIVTKTSSALVRLDILTPQFQASNTVLTAAEFEPYLGRFMMVRFTSNALIATPLMIASREHVEGGAAGGLRPRLSFGFEQD